MFTFNPVRYEDDYGCPIGYAQGVFYDHDLALPGTKLLYNSKPKMEWIKAWSKLAWQVRRIEAKRLGIPVMQVSWRRCCWLAALIQMKRYGFKSKVYQSIRNQLIKEDWR